MANGNIRGNKTLAGTWGEVWVDGVKCFLLKSVKADVEATREDVQIGIDVDSKLVGLKGTGTLAIRKVYSSSKDTIEKYQKGEDIRVQIVAKLQDPDAVDKQTERWSIDNVWFNNLPIINWETGTPIEEEYEFGYTPTDLVNLDEIAAK